MSSQRNSWPYRLMTPGPTPLSPEVLSALSRPLIHHRTPEFSAILQRVLDDLKWFFQTQQPVMMMTATGSGAMEAALVNTLSPGDEVLSIVSGKFGERWAEMGERFKLKVRRLDVTWGEAVDLDSYARALEATPNVKAVLTQACETSTGVVHPIKGLAQITKKISPALFMVDAITALGTMPLPMDQWDLDVVVGGSQKAFMIPPGLAFIALSQKAWVAQQTAKLQRYYFDLEAELKANKKEQTFFSSAISHIVALDVAFQEFKAQGMDALVSRSEKLAKATREAAAKLGFGLYAKAPAASVTALIAPKGLDSETLRDHLERTYRITVMGGQDQAKGKIIRIGHMGHILDEDVLATIEALGQSLRDLGQTVSNEKIGEATEWAKQILKS